MSDKKDIRDFLHLYLGCEVQMQTRRMSTDGLVDDTRIGVFQGYWDANRLDARIQFRAGPDGHVQLFFIKPLLRRLSDMTEEEWKKCFELSRGVVDQSYPNKMTQLSSSEIMFVLGKGQFVFGFHSCPENDVRIGDGICFYSKSYLIRNRCL